MSLIKYKPQSIIYSIRDEIDRLFDKIIQRHPFNMNENFNSNWQPKVDVIEKAKHYLIMVDVPGIDLKDIRVYLDNKSIIIQGEKNVERNTEDKNYKYTERYAGNFYRQITLPYDIEANKVSAKMKNGVLMLEISKIADKEKKYIDIKQE